MMRILAAAVLLSAFGWVAPSLAQVTHAQCDRDYDACKKKHIFDKKPCKKRRDNCFAQLAQQNAAEQRAEVKNRMLNGAATETPGSSMRDRMGGGGERPMTEAEKKAAAKKRLKARQEAKAEGDSASGSSMRDSMRTQ